jgi:regulatory protein
VNAQIPVKPIRQVVLALLARRDYASQELTKKLHAKGYSQAEIEQVLQDLSRMNLVDDGRYTEFAVHRHRERGLGPRRIAQTLKACGIEDTLITTYLNEHDPAWLSIIQAVWHKRFRGKQPANAREYAQQMRFLHYRGFTPEQIHSVLVTPLI